MQQEPLVVKSGESPIRSSATSPGFGSAGGDQRATLDGQMSRKAQ
jgi:hypothetical protein